MLINQTAFNANKYYYHVIENYSLFSNQLLCFCHWNLQVLELNDIFSFALFDGFSIYLIASSSKDNLILSFG